MAYISFQPKDFFSSKLYTGNSSSAEIPVTGVGFQPDFVWVKNRDATYDNFLFDSARGATKYVRSNTTAIEGTNAQTLKSFDADGYTMGTDSDVNQSTSGFASWSWKAGTTSGITTNGSTSITPSAYSFNQTAGISILKFTGNYTNGAKLAHGLGVAPEMVFFKTLENVSLWGGYNKTITATDYIKLDSSDAATAYALAFDDTEPDAVNITLGSWEAVNGNVGTTGMVAYAFASKKGFSKIGSYVGDGLNGTGTMVYTGFRPAYLLVKCTSHAEPWLLWDDKRLGYNVKNWRLMPNQNVVENESEEIDLLSNGFKLRSSGAHVNGNGRDYMYMAFAEFPTVSSNNIPGVAR